MEDKLIELIKFSLNDKGNYINLKIATDDNRINPHYIGVELSSNVLNEIYTSRVFYTNKAGKEVDCTYRSDIEFNEVEENKLSVKCILIEFKTEPKIIIRSEMIFPKGFETTDTQINGFRYRKLFNCKFGKKPIVGIRKDSYMKLKYTINCGNLRYEIDEELMNEFYNLAFENKKRFSGEEYLDVINDRLQKYKDG